MIRFFDDFFGDLMSLPLITSREGYEFAEDVEDDGEQFKLTLLKGCREINENTTTISLKDNVLHVVYDKKTDTFTNHAEVTRTIPDCVDLDTLTATVEDDSLVFTADWVNVVDEDELEDEPKTLKIERK